MCGFVFGRGVSIRCLMRNQIYYRGATVFLQGLPTGWFLSVEGWTLSVKRCVYMFILRRYIGVGAKKNMLDLDLCLYCN